MMRRFYIVFYYSGNKHYDIPKKRIQEIQSKCNIVSEKDILKIIKGEYT